MLDKRIIDELFKEGFITEGDYHRIKSQISLSGVGTISDKSTDVVTFLVSNRFIDEEKLTDFISTRFGIPKINLQNVEIDSVIISLLPINFIKKHKVIPFERWGKTLKVAMVNPLDIRVIDDIEFITGNQVQPYVAPLNQILFMIDKILSGESSEDLTTLLMSIKEEMLEVVEEEVPVIDITDITQQVEQAPVVKLVNSLIADAVRKGASDIHLEPGEKVFRVRYRIDGILYEMMQPPYKLKDAIISRIKVMAKMDIAERRLPQDGRIKARLSDRTVDLRVSTAPTIWGEKVVLRVLDKGNIQFDLKSLGFEDWSLEEAEKALRKPYGMILVTGPTGSGKTTTLYSMLQSLNRPHVNILTVEDPVEYEFPGINQVNVKEEIGLNFARVLRAFLRQDPDIIMVGEIRDQETATIAVRAAITGHLVLSTLHTNDAPSTIARLIDMGVEPFLVASSLSLIIAQRLVRKICKNCKVEISLHPEVLKELNLQREDLEGKRFYKGEGCPHCNNTGYKGRIGIFEVMPINAEIRNMILDKASVDEIRERAIELGMITLRESALIKLFSGVTTAEEVLRVTKEI